MKRNDKITDYFPDSLPKSSPVKTLTEVVFPVKSVLNLREIFVLVHRELGYEILHSQRDSPQYVLKDSRGNLLTAEVVIQPWNVIEEVRPSIKCDLLLCWGDELGVSENLKERGVKVLELRNFVAAPMKENLLVDLPKARIHAYKEFMIEASLFRRIYLEGIRGKNVFCMDRGELHREIQTRSLLDVSHDEIVRYLRFLKSVFGYPFHEFKDGVWEFNCKKTDALTRETYFAKMVRAQAFENLKQENFIIASSTSYPPLPWDERTRDLLMEDDQGDHNCIPQDRRSSKREELSTHSTWQRNSESSSSQKKFKVSFPILEELNVREVFCLYSKQLGYTIKHSSDSFPDYILEDEQGQTIKAEVELFARNFRDHGHPPEYCDLIICWMNDSYGKKLQGEGVDVLVLGDIVDASLLTYRGRLDPSIQRRMRIRDRKELGKFVLKILVKEMAQKTGTPRIRLTELRDKLAEEAGEEVRCTTLLNYFKHDSGLEYQKVNLPTGVCLFFSPKEFQQVKSKVS
ncbi:MAG: hypothetical protein GWO20_11810 [Candidatus Korarchaeota archaeon]|nr:hypothetical protein [Candidatus Korarchaeota archaeon]NIU84118.1 hypothetical protein [Candidatus Thorarchaeota archaeon]NIW14258.1 hypothetical protein [Candidatus Thorarchaeota archaeon]NIW52354.1 hypothetical protein [Candidatus Korarchaeota archaeon]